LAMGEEVHQSFRPSANDHRQGSLPVARAVPRLELSQRTFKASGLTTFRARRRHWDSQNPAEHDFAQPASVPGRPPAVEGMPGEIIEQQSVSPAQRAARMLERHSSSASMSPDARPDRLSTGIGCDNESSCSSRQSMEAALEIRATAGRGPYQPDGPSAACDSSPLLLNPIAASAAAATSSYVTAASPAAFSAAAALSVATASFSTTTTSASRLPAGPGTPFGYHSLGGTPATEGNTATKTATGTWLGSAAAAAAAARLARAVALGSLLLLLLGLLLSAVGDHAGRLVWPTPSLLPSHAASPFAWSPQPPPPPPSPSPLPSSPPPPQPSPSPSPPSPPTPPSAPPWLVGAWWYYSGKHEGDEEWTVRCPVHPTVQGQAPSPSLPTFTLTFAPPYPTLTPPTLTPTPTLPAAAAAAAARPPLGFGLRLRAARHRALRRELPPLLITPLLPPVRRVHTRRRRRRAPSAGAVHTHGTARR